MKLSFSSHFDVFSPYSNLPSGNQTWQSAVHGEFSSQPRLSTGSYTHWIQIIIPLNQHVYFLVTNPLKDDKSIQWFFWFFGLSENTQKSGGDSWWILIFPQKTHHFSGYTQLSTTQFGTLYPHQRSLRQLSGCPPPKPKKLLRAMPMLAQHPDWPWGGRVYPTRLSMGFPSGSVTTNGEHYVFNWLMMFWCNVVPQIFCTVANWFIAGWSRVEGD